MAAIFSFLAILVLSTLAIRVATVALTITGVSRDIARFQAMSAFTGVGFTTAEAEDIINHPARRRIIAVVIRLGNLGLITTITSLILAFVDSSNEGNQLSRLAFLGVALLVLALLANSERLDDILSAIIRRIITRWTGLDVQLYDYEQALNVSHGYRVGEITVHDDSWVANRNLDELELVKEGIIVLGIKRDDGTYVGVPHGETHVCTGDDLVLYGHDEDLSELNTRLAGTEGDERRRQAVQDQQEKMREQTAEDTYSHT